MGRAPLRVDLLQQAPGVSFASAWQRRETADWGGTNVPVIGLEDLIAAKRAAGRDQDLLDAKNLERVLQRDRGSR